VQRLSQDNVILIPRRLFEAWSEENVGGQPDPHSWVMVRVHDDGQIEALKITEDEMDDAEERYLDLLVEKEVISEQEANEILNR